MHTHVYYSNYREYHMVYFFDGEEDEVVEDEDDKGEDDEMGDDEDGDDEDVD